MKTLKLFSLTICMIFFGLTTNAQIKVLQTPDEAEYFIKGNLNIQKNSKGELEYTLTNVQSQGINFKNQNAFKGYITDNEDIAFSFEDATTDYEGGFENNVLQYWRFDEFEKVWQPESEVRQGSKEATINKYINMVLVVDCSSSLDNDFYNVIDNTLYFINQLYNSSPDGNIRLGIIGFSSIKETQIYDITPLNSSTMYDIKRFINGLSTGNGTALYYSMDKAIEMLTSDSKLIKASDYLGSFLITFTDGIDQQSQNLEKDLFVADDYYNYLRPIIKDNNARKKIHNKIIETHIISVKGRDITSDRLEIKFDSDLKSLCDYYYKMDNISKLRTNFYNISKLVIDRSLKLTCYVPMAFKGKVGWTFTSINKPIIKNNPKYFLGVNAGLGLCFCDVYLEVIGGVDLAFPINDKFAVGPYFSTGINFCDEVGIANLGVLAIAGNRDNTAFMIGMGLHNYMLCQEWGLNTRIGFTLPNNRIYLLGEFSTLPGWDATLRINVGFRLK